MPTSAQFAAKDLLWQTLNSRTTIRYNPAKPIPFHRRYHFVLIGFGLVTLLLCILWSASTTGYELVTITSSDFSSGDYAHHWFQHFAPSSYRHEGATCEPAQFQSGEKFYLTPNIFAYEVVGYFPDGQGSDQKAASTSVNYTQTPLSGCNVDTVDFTIDLSDSTIYATPSVVCKGAFNATLKTYYEWFEDPTAAGTSSFVATAQASDSAIEDAANVLYLIDTLASDLWNRSTTLYQADPSQPIRYSFTYIPETNTYADDGQLLTMYRAYGNTSATIVRSGQEGYVGNLSVNDFVPYNAFDIPIENFLSTLVAAVRLELAFDTEATGQAANTLTNLDALKNAVVEDDKVTNVFLATYLDGPSFLAAQIAEGVMPLKPFYNKTTIQTTYQCHVWHTKDLYSWLNSVFGIAFSNFGSFWLVVMLFVGIFAERKAKAEREAKERERELKEAEDLANGKKPGKKPPGSAAAAKRQAAEEAKDEKIAARNRRDGIVEGVQMTEKAAKMAAQELKDWIDDLV